MRLRRIDAVRFGRLEDVSLGDLGDGLTVVLGPNGAGKTSITTLVRHVLYGFPTKRGTEKSYESAAGKRLGRLEFDDASGDWIIERTEGVRGGHVEISTRTGEARPDLLERITRGVSRNEFRVVFGFGLDDMPDIEPKSGSGDVLSRFYAAQVGLSVSPQDVRAELEAAAAALYKPRGSTPTANALLAEIKSTKKRIRELEDTATHFAEERARLTELKTEAEAARIDRERSAITRSELESDVRTLESAEERLAAIEESIRGQRAERDRYSAKRDALHVDEELLASAPQLSTLLDEVSGFRERLALVRKLESRVADLEASAQRVLDGARVDGNAAARLDSGPETRTMVERYRDQLARSEEHAAAARRTADSAEDRLRASERTQQSASAPHASRFPAAAVIMLAIGALGALIGLFLREWVSVGIGGALAAAGAVLLIAGSRRLTERAPGIAVNAGAESTFELAQLEADRAEAALSDLRTEWSEWSAANGLNVGGSTPQAVLLLISSVEEWRTTMAARDAAQHELSEIRLWCEEFRGRLASAAGAHGSAIESTKLDDVAGHSARVREALEAARAARSERMQLDDRIADVTAESERLAGERQHVLDEQTAVGERTGDPATGLARVRALAEAAASSAADTDARFLDLTTQVSRLEGELNNEGRDTELAESRLKIAGLHERLSAAVERYCGLAVAAHLLAKTEAFYEEARQPDVVKRAGEVFRSITGGLYERIAIPLGGNEIVAFRGTDAVPTSKLNRGAQEQLYLALRIALVEQLDGVGEGLPVLMDDIFANFDPSAHAGAVKAVTELARHRQVVFFTCHPQVVDSFISADPGATRLELDRC